MNKSIGLICKKFINRRNLLKALLVILAFFLLWRFFSFRLLDVPPGITVDEAAFGYNGVLLEKTYHDQNGRFMPVFVLSINGKDWRQPITQYTTAVFFKIFGPSFYVLRSVSVVMAILSAVLIFSLLWSLQGKRLAIFGLIIFLTTPILMIQAHMGLDNIAPVPFAIIWLFGILLFEKSGKQRYLVLAALSLGIGFYSYKAMRLIVPAWSTLTVIYLLSYFKSFGIRKTFKSIFVFVLTIAPFYAVIPLLEIKYAGSIFDRQTPSFDSYQQFLFPYFSSFDPSFLFIKGDDTPYHSTGLHGAFLLASLPLFLTGISCAIKKKGFWLFALAAFFIAPLFFGTVGSVHRASRLLALIPPYTIISALGAISLWDYKKKLIGLGLGLSIMILIVLNYADFLHYYFYTYPKMVQQDFPNNSNGSYQALSKEAKTRNMQPVIEDDIYKSDGEAAHFFEQAYFTAPLTHWKNGQPLPKNSILLTNSERLPGMKKLELNLPAFKLLIPQQ